MRPRFVQVFLMVLSLFCAVPACSAQGATHYGFDKNIYPGDAMLPLLHKQLAYAGYWLNVPPGATTNSWKGKRATLVQNGFGFLILFNGRLDASLKNRDAAALGKTDAAQAVAAAKREGFPDHAIIFLDLEEGGRLTQHQSAYTLAWINAVKQSSYLPGVYCSGIEVEDDPGTKISTAGDIRSHDKDVALWIANDVCPPAPGCTIPKADLPLANSGRTDVLVWQFAQSPRRPEFTRHCVATYAADKNCYVPGLPKNDNTFLDLNVSSSADPSAGR